LKSAGMAEVNRERTMVVFLAHVATGANFLYIFSGCLLPLFEVLSDKNTDGALN